MARSIEKEVEPCLSLVEPYTLAEREQWEHAQPITLSVDGEPLHLCGAYTDAVGVLRVRLYLCPLIAGFVQLTDGTLHILRLWRTDGRHRAWCHAQPEVVYAYALAELLGWDA